MERRRRPALGAGNRTLGLCRDRGAAVGIERVRQLAQLIAGAPGLLEISAGEHDLDVRRQQACAPHPIAGGAREPEDRRARRFGASLGQPKQREPGLGLESQLAARYASAAFANSPHSR
jgi:hypothetical protein